jgi:hypothetical protein
MQRFIKLLSGGKNMVCTICVACLFPRFYRILSYKAVFATTHRWPPAPRKMNPVYTSHPIVLRYILILSRVSVAVEACLQSHCLATDTLSGSAIPVFSRHVILLPFVRLLVPSSLWTYCPVFFRSARAQFPRAAVLLQCRKLGCR